VRLVRALPDSSHAPIAYAFAAIAGGNEAKALDFLGFLTSPEGLSIFAQHGFAVR